MSYSYYVRRFALGLSITFGLLASQAFAGDLIWENRYDSPAHSGDGGTAVVVDSLGAVIVTGSSLNSAGDSDIYTAKYAAATGALVWSVRYDGPAHGNDFGTVVALDYSGNVVVAGKSRNALNDDYYTAKYAAANGALIWESRYNGPANRDDTPTAVAVDKDGNVIVTGNSKNAANNSDFYTVKYAANTGAVIWERRYDGPDAGNDEAYAIAVDASGNVVVTGRSKNAWLDYDYYTAKYAAADGALVWEKRYDGPNAKSIYGTAGDTANSVALDASGNAVVTGVSYLNGANADFYTIKYSASNGDVLWEKRYDDPSHSNDYGRKVAIDGAGNVLVMGNGYNSPGTVVKYEGATGALLWENHFKGFVHQDDEAKSMVLDAYGNVIVTGFTKVWAYLDTIYMRTVTINDFYTAKYASSNGALLWEKRYGGPAHDDDGAMDVAVDAGGRVAVTGISKNAAGNYDIYTAKYDTNYVVPKTYVAPNLRDFNRDHRPDLISFNPTTRRTLITYLNTTQLPAPGPSVAAGWTPLATADFNRDGIPDLLLYSASTRKTAVQYLNSKGGAFSTPVAGPVVPGGWKIVAVADFDRDGKPDLLLLKPSTLETSIYYLNNVTVTSDSPGPTLQGGYNLVCVSDLDGNGSVDIALFNPRTRATAFWYLKGGDFVKAAIGPIVPAGYVLVFSADLNADGKADLALWNSATRQTLYRFLRSTVLQKAGPTLPAGYAPIRSL